MKLRIIGLGLMICVASHVAAEQKPLAGKKDPRMRTVVYDPNQVIRLSTGVGAALVVTFSPDETVSAVAATDSKDMDANPRGNFLFIKSRIALTPQPVVVLTTGPKGLRRYTFEIETTPMGGLTMDKSDLYYSVEFVYPGDRATARSRADEVQRSEQRRHRADREERLAQSVLAQEDPSAPVAEHLGNAPSNWRYVAQGSGTFRPVEVHDDGYSTIFRFPGNTRIPSIFRINPDGREAVANYVVKGDAVIVGSVAAGWRLRDGHTVLNIWNRAYNQIGTSPGTATTSRFVTRVTKVGLK